MCVTVIMDIAKCLYLSDNRFVDRWDLKKFAYLANSVVYKKYEPTTTHYMPLDNTIMGGTDTKTNGGGVVYPSTAEDILKPSRHCDTISDVKTSPNLDCVAPVAKPKRARNGFTTLFQFISGFVGTKSLQGARMQPFRYRDTSRPTLNVGSIFEMYQESCLVEDSIRNSRKMEGEHSGGSEVGEKLTSEEDCRSTAKVSIPPEEMKKIASFEVLPAAVVCSDSVKKPQDSLNCNRQPNDSETTTTESSVEPTSDKISNCASNSDESGETMLPNPVEVINNSTNRCVKRTRDRQLKQQRCARNDPSNMRASGSGNNDSEQRLNLKNNLLSTPCIPDRVEIITNGETFSQKRVNDHAVSKTQKRSRKRSRRKARRQRKKSPSPVGDSEQQKTHIPDTSCGSDMTVAGVDEPGTATSTPSLNEVESPVSLPVTSPICFVQPLCSNAAIAFILGVCSDASESDDDDVDGFEWDVGGDDSWENSNTLWESFQCAQLQLSNLKSPVVANSSACTSGIASDSLDQTCADEVDGVNLPDPTDFDTADDCVGSEHACREYPNGYQLSAEQLLDVNRRWAEEIEKDDVSCDKRKQDKTVHFAEDRRLQQVRRLCTWSFAHRAARRGEWEQYARDRARFQSRIQQVEKTIGYVLTPEHRSLVYNKYHDSSNR